MRLSLIAIFAALATSAFAETPPVTAPDDPYIWLEDVHGAKAMQWVEKENARSLAVLKGDPRYANFHEDALKILNATDRIPAPELIGALSTTITPVYGASSARAGRAATRATRVAATARNRPETGMGRMTNLLIAPQDAGTPTLSAGCATVKE